MQNYYPYERAVSDAIDIVIRYDWEEKSILQSVILSHGALQDWEMNPSNLRFEIQKDNESS